MDLVFIGFAVAFMFVVDWRLSKIQKELAELNKTTKQHKDIATSSSL